MADLFIIPAVPGEPFQEQTTTLDGIPYVLRFDWIQRIQRWSFSILSVSGEPLLMTKGLVLGADLLRQSKHDPRLPQGVLLVLDTEGKNADPGLFTLGRRHLLAYFSAD